MSNYELYESTNNSTKKYLDAVFSLLRYFDENETSIKDNDILPISFFLAGLKTDDFIKQTFNSFGITFDKCFDSLKNETIPLEERSALETSEFTTYRLEDIYRTILDELKNDYYLEDKEIKYEDIEPYQIFDYMMMFYYESICALIEKSNGIEDFMDSTSFFEYTTYREDKFAEFAKKYGIDVYEQAHTESIREYHTENFNIIFDDGKLYLFSNTGSKITIPTLNGENASITLGRNTEIIKINDKLVTRRNFDELIEMLKDKNKIIKFTTYDIDRRCENSFAVIKEDMFGSGKMEDVTNKKIDMSETPNLDKYGEDLTSMPYLKDPSVGRKQELERIMKILLYPERDKSVIITGVAGCGKTALVKGLAYRIQKGDVPAPLKDLKIISIDTATMVAGTKYVGTLEEKMKKILDEASNDKNIIIFIDEIHQAVSGGRAEGNDNTVAEILKPYLDYGKVRVIGATTEEEYAEHVESNTAFKTRFKKVAIKEPDYNTTYQVLDDLIEAYNKISYSKLIVSPEERHMIIDWLINSTKQTFRDYKDRASNPRLVLDVLKEAYAIAAFNESKEVTVDHLIEALKNEDRLYESSRERQAQILRSLKPRPRSECKILEFKPRANK
jgi:SpoVK/Ycf46/Vps4 family AAA+-type ATPase